MHTLQVGLFTATMPESLDVVASAWLHRPERISVATSEANISKSVTQVSACSWQRGTSACVLSMQDVLSVSLSSFSFRAAGSAGMCGAQEANEAAEARPEDPGGGKRGQESTSHPRLCEQVRGAVLVCGA
jgi:hypothetical protein